MNIQLQKFDMRQIKDDKVVVLIGKRDTGKSFLVRDLLYYHQDVPIGTVISGTEGANAFYSKIFPSLFIHGEYNAGIISNYMKRQKLIVNEMNRENEQTGGNSNIDPRSIIINFLNYKNTYLKINDIYI